MATRGGARAGAGRPRGGISDLRRTLADAYQLAMTSHGREVAGALADGLTRQELATLGMAALLRQQIKLGEGGDVVRLGVAIGAVQPSSVGESGDGAGSGSALADAFGRLPGAIGAPAAHQSDGDVGADGASAGDDGEGPADHGSAGRLDRLLAGARWRGPMLLDLEPADVRRVPDAGQSAARGAGRAAGAAPAPTPTPPAGPARGEFHPHRSNFEILNGEAVA